MNDICISDPCILFPLRRESVPFLREFRPRLRVLGAPCWARFCGPSWLTVLVLRTGMGPGAIQRALGWLQQPAVFDEVPILPKVVLMAGFAGALNDSLHVGDVVLADEVVDETGQHWPATWPGELPAGPWRPPLIRGRILTAGRIIARSEEKRRLSEVHQTIAVDMESSLVARWCKQREVPFGCVRVISDDVATELPPQLATLLSGANVSLMRLLAAVARSPSLIGELRRLARDTRKAARQLGTALGELLTLTTPWGNEDES